MAYRGKIEKTINQVLGDKVRFIYTHLCSYDKERLLGLLTNQQKLQKSNTYNKSRRRVINRYLSGDNVSITHIQEEFSEFPLSKLRMDDKPLFTLDWFIDSSLEEFQDRVKAYVEYEKIQECTFDKSYRYIYSYDDEVSCYEIIYHDTNLQTKNDSWTIDVNPPTFKTDMEKYKGVLSVHHNRITLVMENDFDHVSMLFETSLKRTSKHPLYNNILYGVATGINDKNQKIPIAKKVILAETKMSEEELGRHYLTLNETEHLSADENLVTFQERFLDASYLSTYQKKIENIHTFFSKVKYSKHIETSLAHHMIFTEFHAFKNMYDKFASNQDYFLSDRKRVYLEFLRFLKNQNEKRAFIVLPIYKKRENVFLYESVGREPIHELVVARAKDGVEFDIVFVIKSTKDLEQKNFSNVLQQLHASGVNISFLYLKKAQELGYNFDFFYAQSHNYVVSCEHLNFTIVQNRQHINGYIESFKKIKAKSFSYEVLSSNSYPYELEHPLLEKLVGDWFCYFYGSFEADKQEQMLWETKLTVYDDFRVVENLHEIEGRLEIDENQSLISLFNSKTNNSSYRILNNRSIKDISIMMMYSKQYQKDSDMLSIGIISRKKLRYDEAKEILGMSDKLILKVDTSLQNRVDDFLLKNHHTLSKFMPAT